MAPYITLFGRTVGSYGLCSVLGLLVSGFVAIRLGRRRGVPSYLVIQAAVSALVGLLAGGHLLYGLLHLPERLTQSALVTFLRCFSGSVYYGGFLGACLSVHWYARHFVPNQTGLLTDLFACAVPLFHAFGRVGCFWAAAATAFPAGGALRPQKIRWCRRETESVGSRCSWQRPGVSWGCSFCCSGSFARGNVPGSW